MARLPRLTVPGYPHHVIQRGNNRQPIFVAAEDFGRMLALLSEYASQFQVAIHAYVLMDNHFHLLATPETAEGLPKMMQAVGRSYVRYFNDHHGRSGTLWEGRFRSCLTQAETYLLACQRYIELNPVRADMVAHPAEYRWSSYRANAQGEEDALVRPHPLYEALGRDAARRQAAYRELFRYELEPGLVDEIRRATNGNYALGNERFAKQVALALGRRAAPGKSGRPRRAPEPESGDLFDA